MWDIAGTVWDVAASLWDVPGTMWDFASYVWAVTVSVHDLQETCRLFYPLCALL